MSMTNRSDKKYDRITEQISSIIKEQLVVAKRSISSPSLVFNAFLAIIIPRATYTFALWFPFTYDPSAKDEFYVPARYNYDPINTRFDNTPWTYVTDYIIFLWMTFGCIAMRNLGKKLSTKVAGELELRKICDDTSTLLGLYAVSVLVGGFCHSFFIDIEQMNSWTFRFLWSITVGSVTYGGCYIGLIGSNFSNFLLILNNERRYQKGEKIMTSIPSSLVPARWFWHFFGFYLTATCVAGGMSYKRPAADIFIAGVCQFIPSAYAVFSALFVFLETNKKHQNIYSFPEYVIILYITGFLLNTPLLPSYPVLLRTKLQLSTVNTIMHVILSISWGMQFLSTYWFCSLNQSFKI